MNHPMVSRGIALLLVMSWMLAHAPGALSAPVLDSSFNPILAAQGAVNGMVALPQDRLLIYGSFTTINGVARKNVAIIQADGSLDPGFKVTDELIVEQIHAAACQPDGKILIGGHINRYTASRFQRYLFRLNPDGSLDESFDAGGYDFNTSSYGIDNLVRAILVAPDGKILVGGDFISPGNHLTRLNGDGTVDDTFNPGSGPNGPVTHIALQSDRQVIIGGAFTRVDGIAKQGVARLAADGALDPEAFGSGVYGGEVLALAVQPDDRVLVGGGFFQASGQDASILARFSAQCELEGTFNPHVRDHLHQVTSLLASNSYIFVGGWNPVMYFGGNPTDHNASFYVLKTEDGSFHTFLNFKGKPTDTRTLVLREDGSVIGGGNFIQRDDPDDEGFYAGLFRMASPFYAIDASFRPIVGGQPDIVALAVENDGRILAGGNFYRIDGQVQFGLTRLTADGARSADLSSPGTEAGSVSSLLVRQDGAIAVAGSFKRIEEGYYVTRDEIVLLDPDGTRRAGLTVGAVKQLAWDSRDGILAVISWYPGIVRLNPDWSRDETFISMDGGISNEQQPDFEFDRINAVAVQPDGKILLGGSFSSFGKEPAEHIIRLNSDGSRDGSFTSPGFTVFNSRCEIFSIALQPDGGILIGGRFSTVGGLPMSTVARLHPDGRVDERFSSAFANQGGTAYCVGLQPGGKVLVGGDLQLVAGDKIYNSLVRLNPDGSRDSSFGVSLRGTVKIIRVAGEAILVGGSMESADGVERQGLLRYLDFRGDFNDDGIVDLADAIGGLKVLSGHPVEGIPSGGDIGGDHRIGVEETVFVLQRISGVRTVE
jgi:uncharacterized delta-60 repeat protein